MALAALLEDKAVDTSTVIETFAGSKSFYRRIIYDTRGYGKISVARAMEVSSNIAFATMIDEAYSKTPEKFINKIKSWHLNEPLGIALVGEGKPEIPQPGSKTWSRNALPSMAYGYNLSLTPLQTLTFYNAIANDGEMVKPRFLKEVKEFDKTIERFDKTVINERVCSVETIKKLQEILKNVVVKGTGRSLYSATFSMAGKTGTAQTEYWMADWKENKRYISSFAGYFPAENPKYSCIVVIHKPSTKKGYYGADVSGPVFKAIAQKIFTDSPLIDEVKSVNFKDALVEKEFETFYDIAKNNVTIMPNVVGMPAMDALALLENMGLSVKIQGVGVVKAQSVEKGIKVKKNQTVVLEI
jgi:cell division protein FtsI (penicillin-binding protein 3)